MYNNVDIYHTCQSYIYIYIRVNVGFTLDTFPTGQASKLERVCETYLFEKKNGSICRDFTVFSPAPMTTWWVLWMSSRADIQDIKQFGCLRFDIEKTASNESHEFSRFLEKKNSAKISIYFNLL